MSKFLRAAFVVATVGMAAGASQAQILPPVNPVAMYGEYGESNGVIVNIPQNPPIVPCVPPPVLVAPPPHATVAGAMTFQHIDLRTAGVNHARCHDREQHINFTTMNPGIFNQPAVGNHGARNIERAAPGVGLAVGDPFVIPRFAFFQNLGPQIGAVLQNVTRQLDTTFVGAMPGEDRIGPRPGPLLTTMGAPTGNGEYTIKTPAARIPPTSIRRWAIRESQWSAWATTRRCRSAATRSTASTRSWPARSRR